MGRKQTGQESGINLHLIWSTLDWHDPINQYLLAVFFTGVIQFVYCMLVGTFPFNAFLAGFISCATSFVLGIALKMNGQGAFGGFIFAHLVLHLAVLNFIG